ncbi:poly(A)-specific ribonuclease PARN isoform X1 [Salvia hispanica]|uniref:poly(A)-specific ribonuclease PARN isoform X1 n=2 Tax=Salvia hispanica TaxID=49212 RepID=UPI0020096554|nr:poly(A)-specific ribonuclease PARN isoform X1 [Salvia hispanica]
MRNSYLARVLTRALQPVRSLCSAADVELKNVTKSNFEPALAELRRHVREADFVAIDLEMTGITSAPWREIFEFDRPDIQYLKVKDSAHKFAVVQFGVCPFRWDQHSTSFVAHPHNFYVFPRKEIAGDGSSYEFLCQTSSLEFLAKYQFDFNTCINEGISYLSRSQEEEALKCLDSMHKDEVLDVSSNLRNVSDMQLVRMADILFAERMKNVVGEWRAGLLRGGSWGPESQGSLNDVNQKFQTTFFQTRPALAVNGLTSRQLKLIKLVTEKHFSDLAYVHVAGESSSRLPLIVYTDSAKDRDILKGEVKACQRKAAEISIKSAIGFRHVIDLLSSERKLIVGHNCFLDLAHVYSKFIGPLPSTAEEFVSAVQTYFPSIVDTKVLLNSDDVLSHIMNKSSTSLSNAFNLLCLPSVAPTGTNNGLANIPRVKVDVQVDNQRFSNWNSGAKHEAGYDAFMTGCVFSEACFRLGIDFNPLAPGLVLQHNEKLQKYINYLYLSWANGDIIDLKTGKSGPDTLGSAIGRRRWPAKFMFSNMILLWGLPTKLKAKDIRECFYKAFGSGSITSVHQMDETAAFVQFSRAELVSDFLELKDRLERDNNNPMSVVHPLSRILETGCVRAASYETYKEACLSPLSELLFADQAERLGMKGEARLVQSSVDVDGEDNREEEGEITLPTFRELKQSGSSVGTSNFQTDRIMDSLCRSAAQ